MTDIEVPEGTPSDRTYLVQMDEDFWKALPDATKQHCYETWLKRAEPMPGVKWIALQLLPDELFPSGDKERPYIEWQREIHRESDAPFTIHGEVIAELKATVTFSPANRAAIIRTIGAKYPAGTRYVIKQGDETLAHGRL